LRLLYIEIAIIYVQQDVGGFDIPMSDSSRVQVSQRVDQLGGYSSCYMIERSTADRVRPISL
jgi:hypothetical protein